MGSSGRLGLPFLGSPKESPATEYLSVPGVVITDVNTTVMTANLCFYLPMILNRAGVLDEVYHEVTVAGGAGTAARMGIYNADADWQPTTLVRDFGTVSVASTGVKSITGIAQALAPGRYLLAYLSDAAPTVRAVTGNWLGASVAKALGGSALTIAMYGALAFQALPAVGTPWDTSVDGDSPFFWWVIPRIESP